MRRTSGRRAGLAALLALTAVVLGTTAVASALTTSGTASSTLNRSDNPVLVTSAAGYSIQEGGTGMTRVAVSDHVVARYALRVTSTASTTRVRAPIEPVTAGQTWTFAADVKASAKGARAQVTVSWYDAAGAFTGWTGGTAVTVGSTSWTRVQATLPVPAGAARGQTVVNVLSSVTNATVHVTQHDVRAPAATAPVGTTSPSGTPSPTSTPAPTSTQSPTPAPTSSPGTTSSPSTTSSPTRTPSPSTTTSTTTSQTTTPAPTASASTTASAGTTTVPATSGSLTNQPAQAASLVWGDPADSRTTAYAHPGGLVVAGRDNYQNEAFKDVSAAGGTVLIYLDAIIDNDYGRYHDMLNNPSACGAGTTSRWPGDLRANQWGYLNDFRVGSVLQSKLECVLETMVRENPHMAGFFADDLGSRSWFPDINWGAFPDKQAYRDGAIALSQTFRRVADRHGLIVIVNGTWTANEGGGYPNAGQHGNALADGGFVEHHDGQIGYFGPYGCASQWADQSAVTRGTAFMYAVTDTRAGRDEYANSGCYAYVNEQTTANYGYAPPWGTFHPTGLPTRAS